MTEVEFLRGQVDSLSKGIHLREIEQFQLRKWKNQATALIQDIVKSDCVLSCDPWSEDFACEHFDGSKCALRMRLRELGIEVG